jgi:hypothetical protein
VATVIYIPTESVESVEGLYKPEWERQISHFFHS